MIPENLSFYLFTPRVHNGDVNVFFAGLIFNLSLILGLGPQNALILKYGLRRQHITLVIIICALCDISLLVLSGVGVGLILEKAPIVLEVLRYGGFLFLLWFAFTCFRDAVHPKTIDVHTTTEAAPQHHDDGGRRVEDSPVTAGVAGDEDAVSHRGSAVITKTRPHPVHIPEEIKGPALAAFMVSVVNPAAWVDLFVVIGSTSASYGAGKWMFLLGTMAASLVWFPAFGYGAAALSKPLSSPKVWRGINTVIGLFMVFMAFRVLLM